MSKKKFNKTSKCRFCRMGVDEVDYKDAQHLPKLTTTRGKLFSRKRSGNCAHHQHSVKISIKRARFMALLPYVT